MLYDEYESKINSILASPDTALAEIGSVLEELKTDLTTLASLKESEAEKDARISALQETNLKLYLSQGGTVEEDDEPELAEGEDVIDEFLDEILKEDK